MNIKLKIYTLFVLCSGLVLPGLSAEPKWNDKGAEYCISFNLSKKGEPGFWRIDNYAFPFDLTQGFTVWDEDGKKYNFNLEMRSKLLTLAAAPKADTKVYIYPNPKILETLAKKRQYYRAGRYFRDWNRQRDQGASQAVNIYLLSYEPKPLPPKPRAKPAPPKKNVKKTTVKKAAVKKAVAKPVKKNKAASKKPRPRRPKRLPRVDHLPGKDFPADDADLKKVFKYKLEQYRYQRNYPFTRFKRAMWWRVKGRFAAMVKSKFKVPKPGRYQFAVKTNDLTQVYFDGKKIISVSKAKASTEKWTESAVFELSGPFAEIETFYRSMLENTDLTIGWRAEGEPDYKPFSQKDFIEANLIEPTSLTSRDKRQLPVIKFQKMGYFQNDGKKQFFIGFETNFSTGGKKAEISWQLDDRIIDSGNKVSLTFAGKIPENIACVVNDSKPFKVIIPADDLENPGELLHRDLYIKIDAPVLIYDDETLDMFAEFHSELPMEIKALTGFKSNSDLFSSFRDLHLFRKTGTDSDFPSHDFIKKQFKLDGRRIANGTELEFDTEGPADSMDSGDEAFNFDSRKVIFKKLAECTELKTENGYFMDSKGNRIIPILHRPTLKEKRAWSLLNSLPLLMGENSLMLICDDFGKDMKLSGKLREKAEEGEFSLVFEDWKLKDFGADILRATAEKIDAVRNSTSKVLLIVPSSYPILRGVSPRLQKRLLAALIQTARSNENIRKIILTTPFPLPAAFAGNQTMKTMVRDIQHLVNEEEIDFISLPEPPAKSRDALTVDIHPVRDMDLYLDRLIDEQ